MIPMTGTRVPTYQSQPTETYGRRRASRIVRAVATRRKSAAPATFHPGSEPPGCGYARARSEGQSAFRKYSTYATSAFETRTPRGMRANVATAPPGRCTRNVMTQEATTRRKSGAFSRTREERVAAWRALGPEAALVDPRDFESARRDFGGAFGAGGDALAGCAGGA